MNESIQDELIPVRMVNEYVYCPRLAYLEWVEAEWADNEFTAHGTSVHRRVDKPSAQGLPDIDDPDDLKARSIELESRRLGIITRLDILEAQAGQVVPVEYKRGRLPASGIPYDPERVQLCAQGLLLREQGYSVDHGAIYYVDSKQRIDVVFDEELLELTRNAIDGVRSLLVAKEAPAPLLDSRKCPGCSLVGICLPDEVNYERIIDTKPPSSTSKKPRSLHPASDDRTPLYVSEQGASVGVRDKCLQVKLDKELLGEVRLLDVSHVALYGSVQVSTQALGRLMEEDIPVAFFSYGGWFRGLAAGMGSKNAILRTAQYKKADQPVESLQAARFLVRSKIRNSRTLLRRNGNADAIALKRLQHMADDALGIDSVESLLGLEGAAAAMYFSQFPTMFKTGNGNNDQLPEFCFTERNRRPPKDPVNALLSYAYSLLAKDCTIAALLVGMDPFRGVYHANRHGRPALALDLMEPFRPLIADSVVINAINNGVITKKSFVTLGDKVSLTTTGRRDFVQCYERRLNELATHPIYDYRMSYRRILEVQARLFSRWLLGDIKDYPCFETR